MTLVYFAWVRQKLGKGEERIALPGSVSTVAELAYWLAQRDAVHADVFGDLKRLRAAVNREHVPFDMPVGPDDEVAFFPPVTGG